jgi:hypothetical protein
MERDGFPSILIGKSKVFASSLAQANPEAWISPTDVSLRGPSYPKIHTTITLGIRHRVGWGTDGRSIVEMLSDDVQIVRPAGNAVISRHVSGVRLTPQ